MNQRFSSELSAEFTAAYTRFFSSMKHDYRYIDRVQDQATESHSIMKTENNINDWIFCGDFDWRPNDNNRVRFGTNYIRRSFLPARTTRHYDVGTPQLASRDSSWAYGADEFNTYIEADWKISDRFRMNAGIHASLFHIDGKTSHGISPRLSISYRPSENWAVKGAYCRTIQYVHLLNQSYLSLPTGRMWLTTMNHKAVSNAYRHRHNGRHVTRIGRAGIVQLGMDFLHNVNVEQAFAQAYGKGAFPLGRPDTALLWTIDNMIASRKRAVAGEKKHTVSLTAEFEGNSFKLMPTDVWDNKGIADKWYAMLQQEIGTAIHATVIGVEDIVERPAPCFNLATLQSEAISKLGIFPAKTNETAASLFEKGYISSHRTSTSDLPGRQRRQLTRRYPSAKQYDFVPDSRIPYCHGIIVTERNPMFLSEDETRLYNLIAERMEAALAAPRCHTEVVVEVNINGLSLLGSIELPYGYQPEDDILFVNPTGASILGFSQKKPGPLMADEFLKGIYEVMGINEPGRKLPLDGIHDMGMSLQRLIDNGFVKELLGELEVTEKGKVRVMHTEELELSDLGVLMSQIQEVDALANSLTGTAETMRNYEDWIYGQIRPLVANTMLFANKPSSHKCPKCGGSLTDFPSVVACDKCDFFIPKFYKGYGLTPDDIRQLLTFGYTSPIYGFIGKRGCKFSDALVLDRNHGITFADPQRQNIRMIAYADNRDRQGGV